MISLGSRHGSNVNMQSGCTYDFPSYGTSLTYTRLDSNAVYSKRDFTALHKLDEAFECAKNKVLQSVKLINSVGFYLQGTCVDITPAYEPAEYLEYSECFNPGSGSRLSDNMKVGSAG